MCGAVHAVDSCKGCCICWRDGCPPPWIKSGGKFVEGVSVFFFVNSRSGRFLAPALAWTGYWAANSLIKVVGEHLWATSESLILFLLMLYFSRNDWGSPSAGRGSEAALTPAPCSCVSRVTRFGLRCLVLPASLSGCQT